MGVERARGLVATWDEIAVTQASSIWILDPADCSLEREITVSGRNPAWSRDGSRIAFEAGGEVKTAAAAGGDERAVVKNAEQPEWSPDGRSLVFVRSGNLWTVAIDGTSARQITHSGRDEWPSWSPDGRHLTFSRAEVSGGPQSVWVVAAAGGEPIRITPAVEGEQRVRPSWSRDGTQLAYFLFRPAEPRAGIVITSGAVPTGVESRAWGSLKGAYR